MGSSVESASVLHIVDMECGALSTVPLSSSLLLITSPWMRRGCASALLCAHHNTLGSKVVIDDVGSAVKTSSMSSLDKTS